MRRTEQYKEYTQKNQPIRFKVFALHCRCTLKCKIYTLLYILSNAQPYTTLKVLWHEIFLFQNMLPINAFIKVAF